MMTDDMLDTVHPGEVLLEEFLKPMGLSQNRLALDIGVPARRINEIVLGKRRVTADTALRLGRYFDMFLNSGWDCRWTTISISRRTRWAVIWTGKSGPYALAPVS